MAMEMAQSNIRPLSLIDTLSALAIATNSIVGFLQECHHYLLKKVDVDNIISDAKEKLTKVFIDFEKNCQNRGDETDHLLAFVGQICIVLDSKESIDACFIEENLKRVSDEWMPFLHALYYSSVVLLLKAKDAEIDKRLSTILLQRVLPVAGRIWLVFNERTVQEFVPESDHDWLEITWALIVEATILSEPPQEFKSSKIEPAISILARLLKIYLPWNGDQNANSRVFERNSLDIRAMPEFTFILKAGLLHTDSAVRKQSLYILKQIIKFCTFYLQPLVEFDKDIPYDWLFIWDTKDRSAWGEIWRSFFLLYESVHETQVHIVEPLLPLLKSLASKASDDELALPQEWWEIIAQRAFVADSANIRKKVIETILSIDLTQSLRLATSKRFLLGSLIDALDNTSLYTNPEAPTHVSAFGLSVTAFYADYIRSGNISILEYLQNVKDKIRSATPALFLLQALLCIESESRLGSKEISLMIYFSRNHSLFHNIKARRLVRWQLLQMFLRLANTSVLKFNEIASVLTEFLRERAEQLTIDSNEYQDVNTWLREKFGETYIDSNISLGVQQYFASMDGSQPVSVKELQRQCDELATMLSFTLAKRGGFAQSVRPLYQQMALLGAVDTSFNFVIAGMTLFTTLNFTIKAVSRGEADLMANIDVSARLYEWIAVLEILLLKNCAQLPDLASIEALLDGIRLLFGKALEEPDALVAYLDILLYRMVDFLAVFEQRQTSQEAETYELQLQKMVSFSLMDAAFEALETLGSFHLGFLDENTIRRVFTCELEKPSALNDDQIEDWNALVASFSRSRWSLIATMAKYSRHSAEMHRLVDISRVFRQCVDALEVAKYKSVLAIFNCMRILIALPPFSPEDVDAVTEEERSNDIDSAIIEEIEYEIAKSEIEDSISVSNRLIDEAANTPTWYYLYLEAFIDYFFQPTMLDRKDIADASNSIVAKVLSHLLQIGVRRKNIIPRLSRNLYSIWSDSRGDNLLALKPYFIEMLLYGPSREDTEDQLAHALTLNNHVNGDEEKQHSETVESLSLGNDYLVRVRMNNILLHLDPKSDNDRSFVGSVIDDLLDSVLK